MSYFVCESSRWYSAALCRRYLVARFGRLSVPMLRGGVAGTEAWHWALGLFRDGQFEVLGAWREEGAGTAHRIASDLHDRGLERVSAIAAEDELIAAAGCLRPVSCRNAASELIESGAFGLRMNRAIQWTEAASQHLQAHMSRVARRQAPFSDPVAVADFIAQAFQRADRDLLHDRWDLKAPRMFGQAAFAASLAGAA